MKKMIYPFLFLVLSMGPLATSQSQVPAEPGLYCSLQDRFKRIEGQVESFTRSGSRLAHGVTLGIKTSKRNVQILGKHAPAILPPNPVFYYRVPPASQALGGTAGDLVLIKMEGKGDRRQFEVAAGGKGRASTGPSILSQLQVFRELVEGELYKLTPAQTLKRVEYCFYLYRTESPGLIYDFTVE